MPLFVRKFVVDFVEGSVAFVLALTFVFPGTTGEAQSQAIIVGGGVAAALVSAARRNAPAALLALREALGVPAE